MPVSSLCDHAAWPGRGGEAAAADAPRSGWAARPAGRAGSPGSPAAVAVPAAAASACALWLAAPPIGIWWLAGLALVPVAVVALRAGAGRWSRLAVPVAYGFYLELLLVPALPFGVAAGQWGEPVLPVELGDSPVVFVAVVAVPLASAALYAARFGRPWPARRTSAPAMALAAVLYPAGCWTALDLFRSKLDPGGLWGPLFLSQHDAATADLAALGGPWLVTFAIAASGYALALPLARGRAGLGAAALGLVVVAALLAASALAAAAPGPRTVTVAAVQPGYDTAQDALPVLRFFRPGTHDLASLDLIDDLTPLTRAAARQGARLVVWPEAVVWADPRRDPRVRAALEQLARESAVALVVPYFVRDLAQAAAVVVGPSGVVGRPQPKQRPMWFLGEDGGNRVPPQPVRGGGIAVGALLGVDNQDPAAAQRLAAGGADVLTSSTHDWPQLAVQQRALSQLHAAAVGVPLVRADWQHGSAIYSSGGRRIAAAGISRQRIVLVADVGLRGGSTPYRAVGDALGWTIAGATLMLAAAAGMRSPKTAR